MAPTMRGQLRVAVVRGSLRHKGNLVRGLEAPFSGPEDEAPGVRLFNGVQPAKEERRQRTTADPVSAPPRARARDSSPPDQERPAQHAAAPGAAGLPVTGNGGRERPNFTPSPPNPRAATTLSQRGRPRVTPVTLRTPPP